MNHHAGLDDLVVLPLPVVLLDDGRKKLFVAGRADVGFSRSKGGGHSHVLLISRPQAVSSTVSW